MYRQLDYQDRVIAALDAYLDLLKAKKAKAIGANKPPREL
jgi:hypothetical protein